MPLGVRYFGNFNNPLNSGVHITISGDNFGEYRQKFEKVYCKPGDVQRDHIAFQQTEKIETLQFGQFPYDREMLQATPLGDRLCYGNFGYFGFNQVAGMGIMFFIQVALSNFFANHNITFCGMEGDSAIGTYEGGQILRVIYCSSKCKCQLLGDFGFFVPNFAGIFITSNILGEAHGYGGSDKITSKYCYHMCRADLYCNKFLGNLILRFIFDIPCCDDNNVNDFLVKLKSNAEHYFPSVIDVIKTEAASLSGLNANERLYIKNWNPENMNSRRYLYAILKTLIFSSNWAARFGPIPSGIAQLRHVIKDADNKIRQASTNQEEDVISNALGNLQRIANWKKSDYMVTGWIAQTLRDRNPMVEKLYELLSMLPCEPARFPCYIRDIQCLYRRLL